MTRIKITDYSIHSDNNDCKGISKKISWFFSRQMFNFNFYCTKKLKNNQLKTEKLCSKNKYFSDRLKTLHRKLIKVGVFLFTIMLTNNSFQITLYIFSLRQIGLKTSKKVENKGSKDWNNEIKHKVKLIKGKVNNTLKIPAKRSNVS